MSYKIIGKYIKDLNFNIPNPKTFFLLSKNISNYKINIDIKSNQIKQNIIEILATLNLAPIKNDFEKIETKIVFATIIVFLVVLVWAQVVVLLAVPRGHWSLNGVQIKQD